MNTPDVEWLYTACKAFVEKLEYVMDSAGQIWKWYPQKKMYALVLQAEMFKDMKEEMSLYSLVDSKWHAGYLRTLRLCAYEHYQTKHSQGNYIAFDDMGINYKTGEHIKVGPGTFWMNAIPWKPTLQEWRGPTLKEGKLQITFTTETLDAFLSSCVGHEYVQTLKDLIAYCCIPQNPLKLIGILYGPANSGKTTFIRILKKFFGEHNTHTSLYELLADSRQRFETTNLRGKLVVFCSEVQAEVLYSTSTLKQLSGGDPLRGEYKFVQGTVTFDFPGKILIATNDLPQLKNKTDTAFMGRCAIIEFPHSFETSSVPIDETIPEREFYALAYYCKERILYWQKHGITITNLPTWDKRVEQYSSRTNPLLSFCQEYIEFDENFDAEMDTAQTYYLFGFEFTKRFNEYLSARGFPEYPPYKVGSLLAANFEGKYTRRKVQNPAYHGNKTLSPYIWGYVGMRWKDLNRGQLSPSLNETSLTPLNVDTSMSQNGVKFPAIPRIPRIPGGVPSPPPIGTRIMTPGQTGKAGNIEEQEYTSIHNIDTGLQLIPYYCNSVKPNKYTGVEKSILKNSVVMSQHSDTNQLKNEFINENIQEVFSSMISYCREPVSKKEICLFLKKYGINKCEAHRLIRTAIVRGDLAEQRKGLFLQVHSS